MIPITSHHAATLAAIHEAAFSPGERWGAQAFAALLATPGTGGLLDRRGAFTLLRTAADEAELLTIAVAPALRRRGIARALLAAAMADCPGPVFLEVAQDNAPARALYAACGFTECGRRRDYYAPGRHALVLRSTPEFAPPVRHGGAPG